MVLPAQLLLHVTTSLVTIYSYSYFYYYELLSLLLLLLRLFIITIMIPIIIAIITSPPGKASAGNKQLVETAKLALGDWLFAYVDLQCKSRSHQSAQ